MNIPNKTSVDLEFQTLLEQISSFAVTSIGKDEILSISPINEKDEIEYQLDLVSEYTSSFDNENKIPNHYFDEFLKEIRLLKIENSTIEVEGFRKISNTNYTVNKLIKFFKKFKRYYPTLRSMSSHIEFDEKPKKKISSVIDNYGNIHNNASDKLFSVRKEIGIVKSKIGKTFQDALKYYNSTDYLDDIKESFVDNRRVLAVKSSHRRKVTGTIIGSSKTGSIVYVAPEETMKYSLELNNLEFEEKEEIKRILKELTDFFRPYCNVFEDYIKYLTSLDSVYSRAKHAFSINAVKPNISEKREIQLYGAYHPLLLKHNQDNNLTTFPQDILIKDEMRILVISGPNAGGKSITLKTMGLLQIMFQSGILIPTHPKSKIFIFDQILTDIGDNQSIENQLSTYSYRLKNMKYFLENCNKNTLFLIDEFGTGSDPELGGALAEVFLKEFYDSGAFGIITTHYSNLKVMASELDFMDNANMQFDSETFEPLFRLITGEAGSSYTFEVASKNGIENFLIDKAKEKVDLDKVRFEGVISKLQKERIKNSEELSELKRLQTGARIKKDENEVLNEKLTNKLSKYNLLYEHEKKTINIGNKFSTLVDSYHKHGKKRRLISEMFNIIEIEKKKKEKKKSSNKKVTAKEILKIKDESKRDILKIKKKKKLKKKIEIKFSVGDTVKIPTGKSEGIIDSIKKDKAIVNYGNFKTQISLSEIELVKSK
ncbi:MAG: DNA mismatch repair protein MutS [Flavobacteriales bacterium]|nr:MAG: DNA mismatch repair protein MutS [Flavobacteriales bacterium TMED96]RZP11001.1 MAG: DNA mismatch repair protein MutS [Flavobacteriales bacterium]